MSAAATAVSSHSSALQKREDHENKTDISHDAKSDAKRNVKSFVTAGDSENKNALFVEILFVFPVIFPENPAKSELEISAKAGTTRRK